MNIFLDPLPQYVLFQCILEYDNIFWNPSTAFVRGIIEKVQRKFLRHGAHYFINLLRFLSSSTYPILKKFCRPLTLDKYFISCNLLSSKIDGLELLFCFSFNVPCHPVLISLNLSLRLIIF